MISAAAQVDGPEAIFRYLLLPLGLAVALAFAFLTLMSWLAARSLPRLYPDVRLADLDTDDHDLSVGNCDCGACRDWMTHRGQLDVSTVDMLLWELDLSEPS